MKYLQGYKRSEAEVREEIEQLTMKVHELADQLPASHTTETSSVITDAHKPPSFSVESSSNISPSKANYEVSIPVAPTAPPSTSLPTLPGPSTSATISNVNNSDNEEDEGDNNGRSGGSGDDSGGSLSGSSTGTTLEDLEARFAALRR